MAMRDKARSLAKKLGVEISWTDGAYGRTYYADAPKGQRFKSVGTHGVTAHAIQGAAELAWIDLLEDLEFGLEACPEGGDENCREADCPAWKETE